MVDELFSYTRKKIDRRRNDIAFYQDGELLFPYKLSSGEKQMLVILLIAGCNITYFGHSIEPSFHYPESIGRVSRATVG